MIHRFRRLKFHFFKSASSAKSVDRSNRLINQLTLSLVSVILVTDILPDGRFIAAHGAYPAADRPKVRSCHPTLMQQFPMNSNSALPLDKSHNGRDRNTSAGFSGTDGCCLLSGLQSSWPSAKVLCQLANSFPLAMSDTMTIPGDSAAAARRPFGLILMLLVRRHARCQLWSIRLSIGVHSS